MSLQTEAISDKATLQALREFWQSDSLRIIHACKTALAVTIGMAICMRLELDNPRTTMVSIVIVMMHQQVGMTIARSIYRLLGMLAGCIVALIMVMYLSQSFGAFFVVLACWTAFCVWGAFFYRNYQSYAFVLAGYATAIAAVPAWADPYGIVDRVIFTISDVTIAVITASTVNALIFPQSVGAAFFAAGQRHCSHLIDALRTVLDFAKPPAELDALHLTLSSERVQVETLRSAAVFEDPELRQRSPLLWEITSEFLDVTTTLHAIKQIRTQVKVDNNAPELKAIDDLSQRVAGILPRLPDSGSLPVSDIALTEKALGRCQQLCSLPSDSPPPVDETTLRAPHLYQAFKTLLREAIEDLVIYLRLFAAIREPFDTGHDAELRPTHATRYVSTANRWVAIAAAARALIVVGVVSSVWYFSGWDDGSTAVTGATITCALFATFPNPTLVSRQLFLGAVGGAIVAWLFGFLVLPHLDGFPMLAAALAPVIMFGSYLGSFPSLGPTGISFSIYFCYVADITNPATYDPTALLDAGFAFCTGIGVAVVAFGILIPHGGAWATRFYVHQLRRMVSADACRGDIDPQSLHRFESGVRDYMIQVGAPSVPESARQWGFAVLDVGSAVLKVRAISLAHANCLPPHWQSTLAHWQESIALLFETVNVERHAYAMESTDHATALLNKMHRESFPSTEVWLESLRACLQVVGISLSDGESPLHPTSAASARR